MQVKVKTNYLIESKDLHLWQINDCKPMQSKTGNDFYSWECEIVDETEHAGEKFNYATGTEFGPQSKAYRFLLAAGLPPLEEGNRELDIDTDNFLGVQFYARVDVVKGQNNAEKNEFRDLMTLSEYEDFVSRVVAKKSQSKVQTVAQQQKSVGGPKPAVVGARTFAHSPTVSKPAIPRQPQPVSTEEGDDLQFPKN